MSQRGARLASLASGLVFALGLGISGMARPGKVLGFLDIAGAWDPSLALVMVGAIAVHMAFALRARRAVRPLLGPRFYLPTADAIDGSLVLGSSLFGVGWGLQGYCPGPAIVASASGSSLPIVFVASMVIGLLIPRLFGFYGPSDASGSRHRPKEKGRFNGIPESPIDRLKVSRNS